jgi:hypothetical protein
MATNHTHTSVHRGTKRPAANKHFCGICAADATGGGEDERLYFCNAREHNNQFTENTYCLAHRLTCSQCSRVVCTSCFFSRGMCLQCAAPIVAEWEEWRLKSDSPLLRNAKDARDVLKHFGYTWRGTSANSSATTTEGEAAPPSPAHTDEYTAATLTSPPKRTKKSIVRQARE